MFTRPLKVDYLPLSTLLPILFYLCIYPDWLKKCQEVILFYQRLCNAENAAVIHIAHSDLRMDTLLADIQVTFSNGNSQDSSFFVNYIGTYAPRLNTSKIGSKHFTTREDARYQQSLGTPCPYKYELKCCETRIISSTSKEHLQAKAFAREDTRHKHKSVKVSCCAGGWMPL